MLKIVKDIGCDNNTMRRRVALACESCRQRKTRCDGIQPTCGICQKRKIPCVYGKRYTRAYVSVDYVKSLEEKLRIISNNKNFKSNMDCPRSIASVRSIKKESPYEGEDVEEAREEYNLDDEEMEAIPEAQAQTYLIQQNSKFHQTESSEYSTSDVMRAGSEANPNLRTKDESFYGRSAAMSFMKELFKSVDGSKLSDEEAETAEKCKYKMFRSDKSSNKSVDIIKLPPRSVANNHVKNYFDYAYPLYPFIHKLTAPVDAKKQTKILHAICCP